MISGLFGSGDQETTSHVDYGRMVRDAEAAGFNPLTAIRNGGSAGFTSTTTPGNPVGGALSRVGDWLTNFNPFEDAERAQRGKLLDAQIANLNAETGNLLHTVPSRHGAIASGAGVRNAPASLSRGWEKGPPVTVLSQLSGSPVAAPSAGSMPGGGSTSKGNAALSSFTPPELKDGKLSNTPWLDSFSNGWLRHDPTTPDMAGFEDAYGDSEIGSTVAGAVSMGRDLLYNADHYIKQGDRFIADRIGRLRKGKPYKPARVRGSAASRGQQLYQTPFGMPLSGPSY
ncbi:MULTISPECIES: hypothetical protein [unclassified Mesorhizobium]|uniref:hypothetical protein n=1 Tax=unclassified Mesorhizobium TaxID=325217 RepID=UPI000FCAB852|nr:MULTISPECIES: hypothetical protein [unclassified Mesorhizobium]RUW01428.1 hypothetical protein EOA49_11265 [Mesorhizobium sp. M1A.F.Ca.IN.020.04.1.1]RUW12025.1 hypothetical protein EOA53_11425 [Mesorhizobium sp. M1A.F.Ca.IN.020.03.1.1]